MNQETIIQVMKFMRETCKSNEQCKGCIFRISGALGEAKCGLAIIPAAWCLNEPRDWKAFKE